MRLGILGPVEYRTDRVRQQPSGVRQQMLLATLLVACGQVVPKHRLVEALWDADPPETADRQIVNGASMLRRELLLHGGPTIEFRAGGYVVDGAGFEVDERIFGDLSSLARRQAERGDLSAAADTLRKAIALWRGPALAGLNTSYLRAAARHLDELRLTAHEDVAWLELRQYNAGEALRLLAEPLGSDPYRERSVYLQMIALAGVGRRTDALGAFHSLRAALANGLGIQPQAEVAHLFHEILLGTQFVELVDMVSPAAGRRADDPIRWPSFLTTPAR